MKPETRIKRLFNRIRKRYKINQRFKIKIIKKETKRKLRIFMTIEFKKIPVIRVYVNNLSYRFEKTSDSFIKRNLAHEIIHFLVDKHEKEKDPKKLIKTLKLINMLIDAR